ncbi:MAG: hypothetical protein AAF984_07285 [Verrucomicrobiota bacterium]
MREKFGIHEILSPHDPGDAQVSLALISFKEQVEDKIVITSPCVNAQEIDQEIDGLIADLEALRFSAKHSLATIKKFPHHESAIEKSSTQRPPKKADTKRSSVSTHEPSAPLPHTEEIKTIKETETKRERDTTKSKIRTHIKELSYEQQAAASTAKNEAHASNSSKKSNPPESVSHPRASTKKGDRRRHKSSP